MSIKQWTGYFHFKHSPIKDLIAIIINEIIDTYVIKVTDIWRGIYRMSTSLADILPPKAIFTIYNI